MHQALTSSYAKASQPLIYTCGCRSLLVILRACSTMRATRKLAVGVKVDGCGVCGEGSRERVEECGVRDVG